MTFLKRLRFYLIGFSIGVVLVTLIFGPRACQCSYLPNARVLEEAKFRPMFYSDEARAFMEKENIDSVFLYKRIFSKSKITNFGTEEVRTEPCRTYRAVYEGPPAYKLVFEICENETILKEIEPAGSNSSQ